MQADGGFVEHVTHALQVAAQLRRQADALRLATAERGRAPVQREVAQAHFFRNSRRLWISGIRSRAMSASRASCQPAGGQAHPPKPAPL